MTDVNYDAAIDRGAEVIAHQIIKALRAQPWATHPETYTVGGNGGRWVRFLRGDTPFNLLIPPLGQRLELWRQSDPTDDLDMLRDDVDVAELVVVLESLTRSEPAR
jgi:hypothetical protein